MIGKHEYYVRVGYKLRYNARRYPALTPNHTGSSPYRQQRRRQRNTNAQTIQNSGGIQQTKFAQKYYTDRSVRCHIVREKSFLFFNSSFSAKQILIKLATTSVNLTAL